MFMTRALECAARLSEVTGNTSAMNSYRQKSEALHGAINEHLWCNKQNAYIDCIHEDGTKSGVFSMQTQIVAYVCEVAKNSYLTHIEEYIQKPPEHFVQIGSPFMASFLYEALTKLKRTDMILEHIREYYGMMVKHGATTCWEVFPGNKENRANPDMQTRSHCHAWSSAPAYYFGLNILGVRNSGIGWDKVIIEPNVNDLTWASGSVPLPTGGKIDVAWELTDNKQRFILNVTAPDGIEIELIYPKGYTCESMVELIGEEGKSL